MKNDEIQLWNPLNPRVFSLFSRSLASPCRHWIWASFAFVERYLHFVVVFFINSYLCLYINFFWVSVSTSVCVVYSFVVWCLWSLGSYSNGWCGCVIWDFFKGLIIFILFCNILWFFVFPFYHLLIGFSMPLFLYLSWLWSVFRFFCMWFGHLGSFFSPLLGLVLVNCEGYGHIIAFEGLYDYSLFFNYNWLIFFLCAW